MGSGSVCDPDGFIHAYSMHWLFNMFTLYFFGCAIGNQMLYRPFVLGYGFVVFYVLAIIVAIIDKLDVKIRITPVI